LNVKDVPSGPQPKKANGNNNNNNNNQAKSAKKNNSNQPKPAAKNPRAAAKRVEQSDVDLILADENFLRLKQDMVTLRDMYMQLNASVSSLRSQSSDQEAAIEKQMTKVRTLINQFGNSVGKGKPMNMSLLSENILRQVGQILNPASVSGEPIPLPGVGKALKYIKHIYQPVRSLDLIEGKTNLLMTPNNDFNFWETKAFTFQKADCSQIKLNGVKISEDVDSRSTVAYGVTSVNGASGRFTVPQCQVRNAIRIGFEVGKSGGFVIASDFNGTVKILRSAAVDFDAPVKKGIRYWFGYDGTAGPANEFADATFDLDANDVEGIELIPDDDDDDISAVLDFDQVQVADVNWLWYVQSNTGLGWLGKQNPATAMNPVFKTEINTAMSGWLANDAPALYKGGELIMARVLGRGIPPLGNYDYGTWISSMNNNSATFPLAKGGYQYHVPSMHVEQDRVLDISPFVYSGNKYFYAIDYSVTVDGNIPTKLPCHFLMAYINGYEGVGNFANVSSIPDELGFPRALTLLYSTYLPLENNAHISQLIDRGLSVANDLYTYGRKILTSPVTQSIMKDIVEKGLPMGAELISSLF